MIFRLIRMFEGKKKILCAANCYTSRINSIQNYIQILILLSPKKYDDDDDMGANITHVIPEKHTHLNSI